MPRTSALIPLMLLLPLLVVACRRVEVVVVLPPTPPITPRGETAPATPAIPATAAPATSTATRAEPLASPPPSPSPTQASAGPTATAPLELTPPSPPTATLWPPLPTVTPVPLSCAPKLPHTHVVRLGQTMSALAACSGASVQQIVADNCLPGLDLIPGQGLALPPGCEQAAETSLPADSLSPYPTQPGVGCTEVLDIDPLGDYPSRTITLRYKGFQNGQPMWVRFTPNPVDSGWQVLILAVAYNNQVVVTVPSDADPAKVVTIEAFYDAERCARRNFVPRRPPTAIPTVTLTMTPSLTATLVTETATPSPTATLASTETPTLTAATVTPTATGTTTVTLTATPVASLTPTATTETATATATIAGPTAQPTATASPEPSATPEGGFRAATAHNKPERGHVRR